jgi:hypothetical protein
MAVMSVGSVAAEPERAWRADIDRSPMSPVADGSPGLGIDDAYAVQTYDIERRGAGPA